MQRHALLVGINKYQGGGNLSGCINDIKDIRGILLGNGWSQENMLVITDQQATRDKILEGLDWLMQWDGQLLFQFSGHGSQVPAGPADEDEYDHMDEIICPHDMQSTWDRPISDNVLREKFQAKKKNAVLACILDSCHSGTATRGLLESISISRRKPRFKPSPILTLQRLPKVNRIGVKQGINLNYVADEKMNHLLLAACRDSQTAGDSFFPTRMRYNGVWTSSLVKAYRPGMAVDALYKAAYDIAVKQGQNPQIEGPKWMRALDVLF